MTDEEFRKGLEKHLEETRRHVENVEGVFEQLGEKARAEECVGFEGLKNEHDRLVGEASHDLVDAIGAAAASRTEHYEIAAYENLIAMARAMGEKDAVGLLEQNLKGDKETARQVESIAKRIAREQAEVSKA